MREGREEERTKRRKTRLCTRMALCEKEIGKNLRVNEWDWNRWVGQVGNLPRYTCKRMRSFRYSPK